MVPAFLAPVPIASPLTTEARPILQWIEVSSSLSIPSFHLIGLPSPEVAEARERVRAAIEASEFEFPRRRLVINLSPASIRKRGTGSDLAMALAILLAARAKTEETPRPSRIVASGELGLDGAIKPVGHVMRALYASWEAQADYVMLAPQDYALGIRHLALLAETGLFPDPAPLLVPVSTLSESWRMILEEDIAARQALLGGASLEPTSDASGLRESRDSLLPLSSELERWITVSAIGRHHLLLLGPRGSGKSHALEWLARMQPEADAGTRLMNILIRELHMNPDAEQSHSSVPIRRVGTQVRPVALTGGAGACSAIRPGEFSLAHGGLLLADELPEWPRDSREALREPLERARITVTRAQGAVELPADFTLAANGNLCPCGGWPRRYPRAGQAPSCVCTDGSAREYLKRLSGPVMDRIDIVRLLLPLRAGRNGSTLSANQREDRLSFLRERVRLGRGLAASVWGAAPGSLPASEIEALLRTHPEWRAMLADGLPSESLRSRHKIARVAMSLAIHDSLKGAGRSPEPRECHFEEARYCRFEAAGILD